MVVQLLDLKIAFKGSAKVDHEVKERRDGSLLVKYISHMSGDVTINLVCCYQDPPFSLQYSLCDLAQHKQANSSSSNRVMNTATSQQSV